MLSESLPASQKKCAINEANYPGTGIRTRTCDRLFHWLSAHHSHDLLAEVRLAGDLLGSSNSSSIKKMPEQGFKVQERVSC